MLGWWVKVAGVWQEALDIQVRISGTYKPVQKAYRRVAGVWQQVYQRAVYSVGTGGSETGAGAATITTTFKIDGTFNTTGSNNGLKESGSWVSPNFLASGIFTISAHLTAGTTPAGSAMDTDLALSTQRAWSITQTGSGLTTATMTLTLKRNGVTVATHSVFISAFST